MNRIPGWVWIAGLGGFGLLALTVKKGVALFSGQPIAPGREAAFAASIPPDARPLAGIFLKVGAETGIDPFLLVAVAMRESRAGRALDSSGTGDYIRRTWTQWPLPPDGLGWGRGIMQIDYNAHRPWLEANNWRDPYTNIKKGAKLIDETLDFFQGNSSVRGLTDGETVTVSASQASRRGVAPGAYRDPRPLTGVELHRAVVAAYNTGMGNVLISIAAGKPPDVTTYGSNYGSSVLASVYSYASTFRRTA